MPELIEGKMIRGSAKAICVNINGKDMWIAKSQIDALPGFRVVMAISDWLAWQKGFITEEVYNERMNNRDDQLKERQEPERQEPEDFGSNVPF